MAAAGSEQESSALAELTAFADATIDDDWFLQALILRSQAPGSPEEAAVQLRIFNRFNSAIAAVRIDRTATMARLIDDDEPGLNGLACVDFEVAFALRSGDRSASRKVGEAMDLTRLPMTMDRMRRGLISEAHAVSLVRLARLASNIGDTPDYGLDLLARCETAIYEGMTDQPLIQQLRSKARRRMTAKDPEAFSRAHEKAAEEQDVTIARDEFTSMAWVTAYLSMVDAETLMSAVRSHAAAAKLGGDDRKVGELKVESLVHWAELFLTGENAPRSHDRPIEIGITVPFETVMGWSEAPGEIPGIGLIPAEVVRRLVADAKSRLFTVDGNTGQLLDCGRDFYRPPAELAKAVIVSNPVSYGPFSELPSSRCDLDHNKPWEKLGETNFNNLKPLDRRAHRAKTLGGWHYEICDGGGVVWRSRLGQYIEFEPHHLKHTPEVEPAGVDP